MDLSRRCSNISNNAFSFERAYQNFNIDNYSQEELELFSLRCIKQVLLSINMLQYSKVNQEKSFGFSPREVGKLSEYSSQLILGVNMVGGFDKFVEILEEFLTVIHDMRVKDNTVKKDFTLSIGYELRIMNSASMNKSSSYFI